MEKISSSDRLAFFLQDLYVFAPADVVRVHGLHPRCAGRLYSLQHATAFITRRAMRRVRATTAAVEKQYELHNLCVHFVALGIQHALSFVARPALQHFSTLSHTRHDFRKKKVIEHKLCVSSSSTTFVSNIFHSMKK